jgi:hypothetical protein
MWKLPILKMIAIVMILRDIKSKHTIGDCEVNGEKSFHILPNYYESLLSKLIFDKRYAAIILKMEDIETNEKNHKIVFKIFEKNFDVFYIGVEFNSHPEKLDVKKYVQSDAIEDIEHLLKVRKFEDFIICKNFAEEMRVAFEKNKELFINKTHPPTIAHEVKLKNADNFNKKDLNEKINNEVHSKSKQNDVEKTKNLEPVSSPKKVKEQLEMEAIEKDVKNRITSIEKQNKNTKKNNWNKIETKYHEEFIIKSDNEKNFEKISKQIINALNLNYGFNYISVFLKNKDIHKLK